MEKATLKKRILTNLLLIQVVLLIAQFVSGMVINQYENVPFQVNFATFGYTAEGAGYGVHHYLNLFIIFIAALTFLLSVKMKNSLLSKLSLTGLILLVASMLSGTALIYWQANKIYSILMAAFFIAALITYVAAIFVVKKNNAENTAT